ncbi:E3 ubiquitin-protein ligase Ubr3 [Aedes albopictus]|uniref:E3 ubiquitin-protein ligase n=1 Tax=Aedes albopictus TaxID=7160 RepID=A0ABM1YYD4_AEDAL|nr:E3 ubiquitin-protein ligase Ubr3 [Aedes albopictus]
MESFYAGSSPSSSRGSGSSGGSGRRPSSSGDQHGAGGSSSSSHITLERLKEKGKKLASAHVQRELAVTGQSEALELLLDEFLSPIRPIADADSIEWCKWLIAGGRTPGEFASIVRGYDNHAKCGLVWIPHVVAYRCRTCGISPCMSICRDCFKRGNHTDHDFNMFLSLAGGACDCGDTSVMKAEGFCSDHGINNCQNKSPVPDDLMVVAEAMMPRLLLRLLLHFRDNNAKNHNSTVYSRTAKYCDDYCSMLMEFNNMGELMRRVMTKALIDEQTYRKLVEPPFPQNSYGNFLEYGRRKYEEAVRLFPSPEPPDEYKHLPALGQTIVHKTLLEEFIFWTFKYEFPQNIVCFLLNMLPDQDYKEHLTRTFVMHYCRIPSVLEMSNDPDTLSNRVVHMSVQLFSNESLALKMVEELSLLHVMIISLKQMMSKILIANTLHDPSRNFHYVIDCAKRVMKDHCYWPLASDFNNVLSHESVALVFLKDDNLIDMWFQFLSMLQGMNVNIRETGSHVEFEPSSYYAAFSCELEASAYPMWSIISHLKDPSHAPLAKKIMLFCVNYLQDWLDAVNFYQHPKFNKEELYRASFHYPLHRYLAAFICQGVKKMGMSLSDILPSAELLPKLMMHPLRVQSLFYEILSGIWVRNGLQIKGQAMTYLQANFCNSMVDMDLFFLQICATQLPANMFLTDCIAIFGVSEWLGMGVLSAPQEMEQDSMLEGLLTFLATLITSRVNLGNDETTQCIIEISALLATGDKTHSQLLELMPERSLNAHTRNFERFLKDLSVYRPPPVNSENLEQGLFMPVALVWEKYYDPLHVLLRAVHRRDFQNSMDRFSGYVKGEGKMPRSGSLWPPFRLPSSCGKVYSDPRSILSSRVLHATILAIFYRAVHTHSVSEHMLALAVFLLEMAVSNSESNKDCGNELERGVGSGTGNGRRSSEESRDAVPELLNCYPSNCLTDNLKMTIKRISLIPGEPQVMPANYQNQSAGTPTFDSDVEWELSESETLPMLVGSVDNEYGTHMNSGGEVAIPQDLSVVRGSSLARRMDDDDDDEMSHMIVDPIPPLNLRQALTLPEYHNNNNESNNAVINSGTVAVPRVTSEIYNESSMELVIRHDFPVAPNQSLTANDTNRTTTPDTTMFSSSVPSNPGLMLPFNRVQPVTVPSRPQLPAPPSASTVVNAVSPSSTNTSGGSSQLVHQMAGSRPRHKRRNIEASRDSTHEADTVLIEESILSLLLKLHSQLSGALDSFSLEDDDASTEDHGDDERMDQDEDSCSSSSQQRRIKVSESRIGDGPYFIGNLLRRIARLDASCARKIDDIRHALWPNQRERQAEQKAREAKEREERSKRAKERQKKLMEEFANRQKAFMEQAAAANMDCFEGDEEDEEEMIEMPREKEYDCIICNTTGPSTESNPIGLVVLVESSSIVGHRRKENDPCPLPLNEDDKARLERNVKMSNEFNKRVDLLQWKFGSTSWFLSHNIGWEGGVHVQSCGHHVHLTCQDSYLKSLHTSARPQNLNVERGEFFCPVCRQLANSVLPLSPCLDRPTPLIRTPAPPYPSLVNDLMNLIKENKRPPTTTKFYEAMGRAMENMTSCTQRNIKKHPVTLHSLFSFVISIARINLESEVIQRGGSLCTQRDLRYKPKRDCIVPLLHVLSLHVRLMINDDSPVRLKVGEDWPAWHSWAILCGLALARQHDDAATEGSSASASMAGAVGASLGFPSSAAAAGSESEDGNSTATTSAPSYGNNEAIPALLNDPCALMLKFILLAPLHLDQAYFTCIVKVMYNLLYYQIVLQLCTHLTDDQCESLVEQYSSNLHVREKGVRSIGAAMAFVLNNLERCRYIRSDSVLMTDHSSSLGSMMDQSESSSKPSTPNGATSSGSGHLDLAMLEKHLQRLCLPFLRVAALLRHHIYHAEIPEIPGPQWEFSRLVYYLELVTVSMDLDKFNASKALCFLPGTELALPKFWCDQLREIRPTYESTRSLIVSQHIEWKQPRLLGLPREYERLFTHYHEQPCPKCQNVPKESSICLLCGTIVCLKQACCKEQECCEAVRHSISCGGGTGIFLVVTSTYIIIIRGRRACLWGSLYLDDYDEEDRDLKRGKPLYLSEDRFNLLESQWLSHRFAHTKHTWVWHRDSL